MKKSDLINHLLTLSLVCIGPFTSEELKKFDVSYIVSEVHTVAGAFDAMKISLS